MSNQQTRPGPHWYAMVMGTGIVATAAAGLPVRLPGLRTAATGVWLLAAGLLVALTAGWLLNRARERLQKDRPRGDRPRSYADPVLSQYWGAPPMALMTVGGGALLLGRDLLGSAAVALAAALWLAGTLGGLVVAVAIPYQMMTRHRIGPDAAFGGWLMPLVPPMVSAANGALLVAYVPDHGLAQGLVVVCSALFGVSALSTLIVLPQLWQRLVHHHLGPAALVPTLWIVLGPLGQSITAAHALAVAAHGTLPAPYATGAEVFAVLYGLPVAGFAAFWLALALALTVRTARAGLPFALTWWSFTFPVGTLVTGLSGLAVQTGAGALRVLACAGFLALAAAWLTVAVRTVVLLRPELRPAVRPARA
ncbi:TDT family transporter [Hamadaea tsunoensis]|uniref:TDT family transporter n=1 Tax=Hamadaea tsunoensis TaxID=53368 RepID=UPI000418157A|nr:TDT family transporter [Hamadaea tsunoensis]